MNPNRLNIIQLINRLEVGGIEKVVIELCNEYVLQGHKVYLIVLSGSENNSFQISDGVNVIFLGLNLNSIRGICAAWLFGRLKIRNIIRDLKPDIFHIHSYFQVFIFLIVSLKNTGIKTCIFRTVHTSGLFYSERKLIDIFRLKVEFLAMVISQVNLIAISKTIFRNNDKYFGKIAASNNLVYNGVNFGNYKIDFNREEFRTKNGYKENELLIIYVSRFVQGKNHKFLLEIINSCHFEDCKFIFLGDGPLFQECLEFITENDLINIVNLTGSVSNVHEYLLSADIGIFPSDFEGFPISLIEMMVAKLPILTSDIDIFKEILIDKKTGMVFKLGDKVDFILQLNKLIEHENMRKTLGFNAAKEAKKYDISNVALQTLNLYLNHIK